MIKNQVAGQTRVFSSSFFLSSSSSSFSWSLSSFLLIFLVFLFLLLELAESGLIMGKNWLFHFPFIIIHYLVDKLPSVNSWLIASTKSCTSSQAQGTTLLSSFDFLLTFFWLSLTFFDRSQAPINTKIKLDSPTNILASKQVHFLCFVISLLYTYIPIL